MSATSTEPPGDAPTDAVPPAEDAPVAGKAFPDTQPPVEAPQGRATIAAALLALAGVALVFWSSRGSSFYFDDWAFIADRSSLDAGSLFGPQNQNWHLFTLLIYQGLLKIWGLGTYVPERAVSALTLLAIGWLTYVYARRRVGPWWALAALMPVVFTSGSEIVIWPFQIGQLLSVAAGLGALILLDREAARGRPALIGAAVLLMVSVASSSAGIPMLLLVLADGVLRALRAGRSVRRPALLTIGAALPALLLYGWWYVTYARDQPSGGAMNVSAFNHALRLAIDTGQSATQRLIGLFDWPTGSGGPLLGQLAFAVIVVLVCARIFGPNRADRPRILAIAAAVVGYWFLLAWGRGSTPGFQLNSRYLFLSQVLLVLLLVELGASLRWQYQDRSGIFAEDRIRRVWRGVCAIGVAVAVWAGFQASQDIRFAGYTFRIAGWATNGQNAALGLFPAADQPNATYYLYPPTREIPYPGALYLRALAVTGEQPPTEADLKAMPIESRQYADGYLLSHYAPGIEAVALVTTPGEPPAVTPTGAVRATVTPRERLGCTVVTAPTETATVALPTDRAITVQNTGPQPAVLRGHRYAPAFHERSDQTIAPNAIRRVELRPDAGTAPWVLGLRGSSFRVCNAPAQ